MASWKVAEAKARLSELIDKALHEGAQEITRHGRRAVVVVAAKEWDRRAARQESLRRIPGQVPAQRLGAGDQAPARPPAPSRAVRYLLDTNVISEWTRPRPDPAVVAWLEGADEDALYLSVLAFAEIRLGIELLPRGRKRTRLSAWLDGDLAARFEGRIIGIERDVAEAWAAIVARGRARGRHPDPRCLHGGNGARAPADPGDPQ